MTMTTAEFGRMMKVLDEENITRRWADTYEYFSITAEFTDVLYRHCRARKRDSNSNSRQQRLQRKRNDYVNHACRDEGCGGGILRAGAISEGGA